VGILFEEEGADQTHAIDAAAVLPNLDALSAGLVAASRRRGVRVIPWTARTEADVRKAVALGVDGIIADDPVLVRRVLGR
jgi:glycerophosphoryl diester phosphodiesterase